MNMFYILLTAFLITLQTKAQGDGQVVEVPSFNVTEVECGNNEWKCPTSQQCIPDFFRCDNYPEDCPGNEDEMNCELWDCGPLYWKCPQSFSCIPISARCDGHPDCLYKEDESDCEEYVCHSEAFIKCADNRQCIHITERCDNRGGDCNDQSDERGCYDCGRSTVLCDNNLGCVERAEICDGRKNCADGSDELFCDRLNNTCTNVELIFPPPTQDPYTWNEICPFGLNGSYCNETCLSCVEPFCIQNQLDSGTYDIKSLNLTCVPHDVLALTIRDSHINNLDSEVLGSITAVFLKFSNVSITTIGPNVFENLRIQFLYLNFLGLNLNSIPFVNLNGLFVLNLDFNFLLDIPNLHGAHTLRVLSLNHNLLTTLNRRSFYDVRYSIVSLYLSNNRINNIDVMAFDGLTNLDILDFGNNCITNFSIGLFSSLNNLKVLFLQNNDIYFFPLMIGAPASGINVWVSVRINCSNFEEHHQWECSHRQNFVNNATVYFLKSNFSNCDVADCPQNQSCVDLIGAHKCDCSSPSCDRECSCSAFNGFIEQCDSSSTNIDGSSKVCSVNCQCDVTSLQCLNTNLIAFDPTEICLPPTLTKLDLNNVALSVSKVLDRLNNLTSLILSNQNTSALFSYFKGSNRPITELVIVMSQLSSIPYDVIIRWENLKRLDLHSNHITEINPLGNKKLEFLDLSFNRIIFINSSAFELLTNLKYLNLSNNFMTSFTLTVNPFQYLINLRNLDLSQNEVTNYPLDLLSNQGALQVVKGDDFVICCLAELTSSDTLMSCTPVDPISSCQRILGLEYMPWLIWIQVMFALFGNICVLTLRIREYLKEVVSGRKLNTFLVGVLSSADLCMAVFLIVIAMADQVFKVDYYKVASDWRESVFCKAAGFLSFFSAEASMFTLLIITITRMISVVKPLYYITINPLLFRVPVIITWMFAFLMAIIPFFVFEDFYKSSSICLPTFYPSTSTKGWQFSLFVIILNCLAFVVMMTSYLVLIFGTRKSKFDSSHRHRSKNARQGKLGRRVFMIVTTNFLCWIPICIMGFLSLTQNELSFNPYIYPWTAVILLPINASMNPVIYTLLTKKNKLKKLILRAPDTRSTSLK